MRNPVVYLIVGSLLQFNSTCIGAQQRNIDASSQRILPLPESELSDSQTQMELLKRLRSLIAGNDDAAKSDDPPDASNAPAIDEQQLEQLQQALKKLQDQLPPGIKPPELDSIPKEQLDQAMSNPAVQQQLRKMLEQFSKDGLLPKTDNRGDKLQNPAMPGPNGQLPKPAAPKSPSDLPYSREPQIPTEPDSMRLPKSMNPPESKGQQDASRQNSDEPQPKPADKSWQSLKDAMKKLTDIAQGQKKSPRSATESSDEGQTADISEMPSDPRESEKIESKKPESSPDSEPNGRPSQNRPRSNPNSRPFDAPQPGGRPNKSSPPSSANDNLSDSPNTNSPQELPPTKDEPEQVDLEKKEQSLKTLQDLLERFKNSQRDQQNGINAEETNPQADNEELPVGEETGRNSMSPGTDSGSKRSQNDSSNRPQSSPSPDRSDRVLRRPDRSSPMIPPPGTAPRSSEQGEVFPPMPLPPRDTVPRSSDTPQNPAQQPFIQPNRFEPRNGSEPRSEQSSPTAPEASSSGLFPSVSEFIKDQIQKGLTNSAPDDRVAKSNTPPQNSRPLGMKPAAPQSRGTGRGNPLNRNSASDRNAHNSNPPPGVPGFDMNTLPPDLDVRKELENRGLRGTFEKIVQKAKEESRARQQQESVAGQSGITQGPQDLSVVPAGPSGGSQTPNDPGMQKSLGDLLSGLDDDLQEIAKDAKFNTQPMDSPRSRNSSTQSPSANSDSGLGKIRDAASGFFSDLSKAPQAPATPSNSNSGPGGGGSALATDTPFAIGSIFFVACALIGVGGLIAYLMRKPLMKLVSDATGVTRGHSMLQPKEIQSRADVIAAFHDLALSPRQAVESWWTHRAAAQKLAAESPQSRTAVDTLAEIYEQARYLPDDVELPADKIQSARNALAECR